MRALDDEEPLVRQHVAWALSQIGTQKSREALTEHLDVESDPEVREEIKEALTQSER
jgi:3-methyladenine DNA glycosylase AlkD